MSLIKYKNKVNLSKIQISQKFTQDTIWIFSAYVIVGISGILINAFVGNFYGAEGLGVFNQVFAIYSILGIVGSFGVNHSTVKHIAQYEKELLLQKKILTNAQTIVLITSIVMSLVLFLTSVFLQSFFSSIDVAKSAMLISFAIPFFILNKNYLSNLNGRRKIKEVAIYRIIRWFLIGFILILCCVYDLDIIRLPLTFVIAEIILFLILRLNSSNSIALKRIDKSWLLEHFRFGFKSSFSDAVSTFNDQFSVLILGYFVSSYEVGLFSFALMGARTVLMINLALQQNFNPIISKLWFKKELDLLKSHIRKLQTFARITVIPLVLFSSIGFFSFVKLFMPSQYIHSLKYFYILMIGIGFFYIVSWAGNILTMGGFLNQNIKRLIWIILFTTFVNILGLYFLGTLGVAIATSLSFIFSALILSALTKISMGIRIYNYNNKTCR